MSLSSGLRLSLLMVIVTSVVLQHHCISGFSVSITQNNVQSTALYAKKQQPNKSSITRSNFLEEISDKDNNEDENKMFGIFKKSPGTLIIAPFVFLFGLDLILNILAITRRSLEFALTGEVHPLI